MPVTYMRGNITKNESDLLVNTVNCVGVMGKGVALDFKKAFPKIDIDYRAACLEGRLYPGSCLLFPLPSDPFHPRFWAAFATKNHWTLPSRYEWISTGLVMLRQQVQKHKSIRSIAIPPLGCGNGGLDWARVHPMIISALSDFDLTIYADPPS